METEPALKRQRLRECMCACVCVCAHANWFFFVRGRPITCMLCAQEKYCRLFNSGMAQFMDGPGVRASETDPVSCCFVTLEVSNRCSLPATHDWTETLRLHVPWTAPRKYSSCLVITPDDIWIELNTKEGEKRTRRSVMEIKTQNFSALSPANVRSFIVGARSERKLFRSRWDSAQDGIVWFSAIYMLVSVRQPAGTTTHLADIAHRSKARDNQKMRPSYAGGWKHPASLAVR